MKKVLFTATVDSHILNFHIPFLKYFKSNKYEVHVATNGVDSIPSCDIKHTVSFERSPFKINNIKAIFSLRKILKKEKFDIIHTHTPMGSVVTRLAALGLRSRVIYTAHGFHFYKGAPKSYWAIFFPIEWLLSFVTDTLITINKEDYELAKKYFHCRVEYVPGVGIDEDKFNFDFSDKDRQKLRKSLKIKENDFVMIYPAELNGNKNQEWLINSLKEFVKCHNDVHILLPGKDSSNGLHHSLINQLGLSKQIHILGFRKDIPKLLKISDLSIATSKREGLPVNIMEAMYIGLPIVALNSRGTRDLVFNDINGFIVKQEDVIEFVSRVEYIYLNKEKTTSKFSKGSKRIIIGYLLKEIMKDMKKIY